MKGKAGEKGNGERWGELLKGTHKRGQGRQKVGVQRGRRRSQLTTKGNGLVPLGREGSGRKRFHRQLDSLKFWGGPTLEGRKEGYASTENSSQNWLVILASGEKKTAKCLKGGESPGQAGGEGKTYPYYLEGGDRPTWRGGRKSIFKEKD